MVATATVQTSLTTQAFWLMVARVVSFALNIVLPLLLVRIFDKAELGLYRQAFLIVTSATSVLPLGFHVSAFYYLPREIGERRDRVVQNILLFLIFTGGLAGLIVVLRPDVLTVLLGATALTQFAPALGGVMVFTVAASFLEIVATASGAVREFTSFIIAAQLTKTALMTGAAVLFGTVESVLYAALCQGALQFAVLLWYLNRRFPALWSPIDFRLFGEQASYALPFGVAALMYTVQADFHSYLIARWYSEAEYAIYSIGSSQLPLVFLLRESINTVLISRISGMQQAGQHEGIFDLLMRSVRKLALFYFPLYGVLLVVGRELLVLMYTAQYEGSWPIYAVNLTLLPLTVFTSDPVLRAYSEYRFRTLWIRLLVLVIIVILSVAGLRYFGMLGTITAVMIGLTLERVFLFAMALWILKTNPKTLLHHLMPVFHIAVASASAALAAATVNLLLQGHAPVVILAGAGAAFTAVFALLTLQLNLLDAGERELINRYSQRFLRIRLLTA